MGAGNFNVMNERVAIRSGWNESLMILKGPLTDRKIGQYQRQGFYSQEFRQARRDRQAKKAEKRNRGLRREGSFLVGTDGRQIYSPL